MRKYRKQKVRFHRGDRRPGNRNGNTPLTYRKRMFKKGKDILFEVWQTNNHNNKRRVSTYDFKEDAKGIVDFHNKNQVWRVNGGMPNYLLD